MWLPRVAFLLGLVAYSLEFGVAELSDVTELLSIGGEVIAKVFHTWEVVSPDSDRAGPGEYLGPEIPGVRQRERKLLSHMAEVGRLVGRVENAVHASTEATISILLQNMPEIVRLELRLESLAEIMAGVSDRERELAEYIQKGYDNSTEENGNAQQTSWRLERHTLLDFAEHAVAHDRASVRGYMHQLNKLVNPRNSPLQAKSIFLLLSEALKGGGVQCGTKQSPQQLLLNLFSAVQLVQLQGFAIMQFSWMILRLYQKGNFSLEAKIATEQFKRNQENLVTVVQEVLKGASRAAWRCDPQNHVEGRTFEQVTRLLQGFLVNEVDLNGEATCKENCAYYSYAETYGCYKDQYCSQQPRCHGRLLNCQFFDADMWVCPSNNSTIRRYDWIEYENGKVLGKKRNCLRDTTKVDSWWRYVVYHCSYCMCLCDEEGPSSDRYFSLRPVLSDIDNNKVVTGLRLVKQDRVFHLRIEEGEVKANGAIDRTTLDWKPVDAFSLYGRQIQEGKDYYKLDWEQRAIDLDDLVGAPGYVLTGVRFRQIGGHLNLIIRTTQIDMKTGRLRPDSSIWVDNDNTASSSKPRLELKLEKPDVSTRSIAPAKPDSASDMYVKFSNTDMEADAAQTTIPFIDIQPVVPDPPMLLSGAGLYHKGQPHYGGYIAPKVFTYDYSDVIGPITPKDNVDGKNTEYYIEQGK